MVAVILCFITKTGHGPHSSKIFVLFYVLFCFVSVSVLYVCVCKCVLYYCHRVATQLQLTNISYHVSYCEINGTVTLERP